MSIARILSSRLLLASVLAGVIGAQTAGAASIGPRRPDPAMVAKLMTKSRGAPVRVIVELGDAGAAGRAHRPEAALSSAEVSTQRRAIGRMRDRMMARLGGTVHGRVKTYRALPLVAIEVGPEALRQLASDPDVVRIQEDVAVPPDLTDSIPLIGADVAWAQGHTGAGWTIAILDTGVARNHPFLAGKVVSEACYSTTGPGTRSLCPDGFAESTAPGSGAPCSGMIEGCAHGTHVAGIAAGTRRSFSGVARDAQLISIQVFSRFSGFECFDVDLPSPCVLSLTSDQLLALERVLELRSSFDIAAVNMSLGGAVFPDHCDADVRKLAIDDLRAAGIATVVASGNDGLDGAIETPACISSAIAVGSTTPRDHVSGFSNHAGTVDLLAPGSGIRSSIPGARFAVFDGTSMATPHVAGAFAVLRSAEPLATVDQIETALAITGRPVERAGIVKPRIQVDAALAVLPAALAGPLNDDFADAILLAGTKGSTTGSSIGASQEQGEPTHAGLGGGRSVWWEWQAPQDGTATLSTFGSDFDTVLAVYTGRRLQRLSEVASNDDSAGVLQSRVAFAATGGTVYRIAVDGYQGDEGQIVLNYTSPGAAAGIAAAGLD